MTNQLTVLRQKLDSLDNQLIDILARRMAVVQKVGDYKKHHHITPLDQKRWQMVLASRIEWGTSLGMSATFITEVMETIHKRALQIEEQT